MTRNSSSAKLGRLYLLSSLFVGTALFFKALSNYYRIFEFSSGNGRIILPDAPTRQEKYSFVKRHINVLTIMSVIGFIGITISTVRLYSQRAWLFPLFLLLAYTVFYFLISLRINLFPKDFDVSKHKKLVKSWEPEHYPTVDVFLPTCGEPINVLRNTWEGVLQLKEGYRGVVSVHCLDDAHSDEVKALAQQFNFDYHARPNKGWYKKSW